MAGLAGVVGFFATVVRSGDVARMNKQDARMDAQDEKIDDLDKQVRQDLVRIYDGIDRLRADTTRQHEKIVDLLLEKRK